MWVSTLSFTSENQCTSNHLEENKEVIHHTGERRLIISITCLSEMYNINWRLFHQRIDFLLFVKRKKNEKMEKEIKYKMTIGVSPLSIGVFNLYLASGAP